MIPAKSQIQKTLITNDMAEIMPRMPSFGAYFLFDLNRISTPSPQIRTNRIY